MNLVLNELILETVEVPPPPWGGLVIMIGFVAFYILGHRLHQHFHEGETEDCDRKGVATLLLIGDSIRNFADGIVLGDAF